MCFLTKERDSVLCHALSMKIDLRKAYNSMQFDFIEEFPHSLNFHKHFINWVTICIKKAYFLFALIERIVASSNTREA